MSPGSLLLLLLALGVSACDHGLEPPPPAPLGTLDVRVSYEGRWPPADSLFDLRFVAFRFMPSDTSDFFRLNEIVFSDRLRYNVASDRVVLDSVTTGTFVYSGIAQRFGSSLLDWRPVGLYEDEGGLFVVEVGETTAVVVDVDFQDLPEFPPPLSRSAP